MDKANFSVTGNNVAFLLYVYYFLWLLAVEMMSDLFLFIYFSILPKFSKLNGYHFDNQGNGKKMKENSINLRNLIRREKESFLYP